MMGTKKKYEVQCLHNMECQKEGNPPCWVHCQGTWRTATLPQAEMIQGIHILSNETHEVTIRTLV